jgi:hypothetical protein
LARLAPIQEKLSTLLKASGGGKLELKHQPPDAVRPVEPWEAKPAA